MISLNVILTIILCHWIFDFLCQTDWMGNNKSHHIDALLSHTFLYSVLWIIPMLFLLPFASIGWFILITLITHTITDSLTSKATSSLYNLKLYRQFFNVIGMDQMLHYTQLFITYYFITQW